MFGRKKKNEIIVKLDELPALTEKKFYMLFRRQELELVYFRNMT